MGQIKRYPIYIACLPIKFYQLALRPFLPTCCRFYPSCSTYALEAISHFGVIKGSCKTIKRLLRCQPWSEGGYDPVQSSKEKQ